MPELQAGQTVRANIRTAVNSEMIRREQRDGRDVLVIKSATLPDDIIMNGILYPTEEIEAGYKSLEGSPAPLGHPTVNGMFVSAKSALGLNIGYFGAWNANVQRQGGRVLLEKVIDVERANESKMGRRVLAALEQGRPIHTSTGLTMNLRECTKSDLADLEGFNMEFDHDAILLDEEGAAKPDQGVGMMVNSATDKLGHKITVVNSDIEARMDEHIDMLGAELLEAISRKADRSKAASSWEQIKGAMMEALGLGRDPATEDKETEMSEYEEKMTALNARIEALEATVGNNATALEAINTKLDGIATTVASVNEAAEEERKTLINRVVTAKILEEDVATTLPTKALNALLANEKPKAKPAAGISGVYSGNPTKDEMDFSPLSAIKKEA